MISINNNARISSADSVLKELLSHDDEHFIERAYITLLRRSPDEVGFQYYLNRLASGITKGRVLLQLATSMEAKAFADNIELLELIINKYEKANRYDLVRRYTRRVLPKKIVNSYAVLSKNRKSLTTRTQQLLSNNVQSSTDADRNLELFRQIVQQQNNLMNQQSQLIQQLDKLVASLTGDDFKDKESDQAEADNLNMTEIERQIYQRLKLNAKENRERGN